MSILKFLSGPDPEKLEKKGDNFLAAGSWGPAKLEYERALAKAEKKGTPSRSLTARLAEKIARAGEGLAAAHQETAEDYMANGHYDDARSFLSLAREITSSDTRIQKLTELGEKLETLCHTEPKAAPVDEYYGLKDDAPETVYEAPPEEQFQALCATLPTEVRDAYFSYGDDFKTGYLALNTGDFEAAATHLTGAMEKHPDPSYIPLELATACLHLGRLTDARELLLPFLDHHPDALPAYRLLCDIYWEEGDFQQADALIDAVPEALSESLAVVLLRGETRFRAGDFDSAKALYQEFIDSRGFEKDIALALAGTHEAVGETEEARILYRDIMGNCTSCRTRIDPAVKHKYAELSFSAGIYDTHILELFLALAREIPQMAPDYYARVSRIYAEQGNEEEAARFRIIARQSTE